MSNSNLSRFSQRELRDLSAKLRFALVSVVILPSLGATLTTLGISRPVAAVVVFAGLALLLIAFVVARVSDSTHVTPEEYERRKIDEILSKASTAKATALPIGLTAGLTILRFTARFVYLFVARQHHKVRLAYLFSNETRRNTGEHARS